MIQKILSPRILLHIEGAILLAISAFLYARLDGNWFTFALLFFLPDISIAGYLVNANFGALTYNLAHAYIFPAILCAYGLIAGSLAISLALIWFGHIEFDRLLGFGLKYPTRFQDIHLNRV